MADHDNTRPRRRRLHLTDATAKRLAASGKPKIHYDADLRGFGLRTGGRAAWILAYSLNRVEHRVTIGTLAAWPAKAARIRAQELRQMVDRGQDPLQQRLDERAEKTERVKPVRAVRARSRRRWYPAIGGARMMPRLTRCCARCSSRCSGCHGRRWRSGYTARSSKLPAPKSAASSWAGSSRSGARETITSMRSRTARRDAISTAHRRASRASDRLAAAKHVYGARAAEVLARIAAKTAAPPNPPNFASAEKFSPPMSTRSGGVRGRMFLAKSRGVGPRSVDQSPLGEVDLATADEADDRVERRQLGGVDRVSRRHRRRARAAASRHSAQPSWSPAGSGWCHGAPDRGGRAPG